MDWEGLKNWAITYLTQVCNWATVATSATTSFKRRCTQWLPIKKLKQKIKGFLASPKLNGTLALAVGILCFMAGILITNQANTSVPYVLSAWGATPSDCVGQVDETKLIGFRNKYRLVMICGLSDPKIDPFDDPQIAISAAFRITGASGGQTIDTPLGRLSEVMDKMPSGSGFSVWHSLALLPKSVEVSELKTASDIEKRGGILITEPKVGGFQQTLVKPTPAQMNPTLTSVPCPPAPIPSVH